jgi:hypothetical protein
MTTTSSSMAIANNTSHLPLQPIGEPPFLGLIDGAAATQSPSVYARGSGFMVAPGMQSHGKATDSAYLADLYRDVDRGGAVFNPPRVELKNVKLDSDEDHSPEPRSDGFPHAEIRIYSLSLRLELRQLDQGTGRFCDGDMQVV